jgi:hypothetical protein
LAGLQPVTPMTLRLMTAKNLPPKREVQKVALFVRGC